MLDLFLISWTYKEAKRKYPTFGIKEIPGWLKAPFIFWWNITIQINKEVGGKQEKRI